MKAKLSSGLLIVSYLDYPSYEGLSRRITGIVKPLAEKGIKVTLIAPIARNTKVVSDEFSNGITVKRIDLRRFRSKNPDNLFSRFVLLLSFSIISSFMVINDFIKNKCLIQYQSFYSAFPALVAKLVLRAPIIGDDIVLVNPLLDGPVSKLSDVIITPSSRTCVFTNNLHTRTFYVPNGVEPVLSKTKNLYSSSKFLFVGSLSFNQNLKAVENMLKIASILDERKINFELLIVGGPLSYVNHLLDHEIVKKGKVKFVGRVSKNQLIELYSISGLGLLPFFADTPLLGGQRIKALEFLVNGLLVISGPEGVRGINGLEPGKHYLLANSLEQMCDIIEDCLLHLDKYWKISSLGRNYVSENYSWNTLVDDYVAFLNSWLTKTTCMLI